MREDRGLATAVRHHQQKIVLFFSAMRHFAIEQGELVTYQEFDPNDTRSYFEVLGEYIKADQVSEIYTYEISDFGFRSEFESWTTSQNLKLNWIPNPMFLTRPEDWAAYTQSTRRRLMGDFYTFQRRRLGLLLDSKGEPEGGKWSFDEENRKSLPKSVLPPRIQDFEPDGVTKKVIALTQREFSNHPGDASQFRYAVTSADALAAFQQFLHERIDRFGDYEDAIPQRERTLFHTVMTPYLNCGLITPNQMVQLTLQASRERNIPLNSLEGFLRQIVGWREFIFWMSAEYRDKGILEKQSNFFDHARKLGPAWYSGSTGLPPLDTVIGRARDHAYCHHIERLMIAGAAMLMCEVDPSEAYKWFMEMFIDSAEWVMIPNVLGMSQFADGGFFATKPYLSGSAYILKMGDYSKGPWCDVWDGLYWSFIERNLDFFKSNHRMSTMVGMLARLEPSRKERIFSARDNFVERVTEV